MDFVGFELIYVKVAQSIATYPIREVTDPYNKQKYPHSEHLVGTMHECKK